MKVEFYDCPFCGELGVQTGHGCKEKTNLFKAVKTPKPEETRGMSEQLTDSSTGWDGAYESLPDDTVLGITKKQFDNSLEPLLRKACLKGIHVMIRVDPERDKNCFTVIAGYSQSGELHEDTDDPAQVLGEWLR
jgi:hypothetical protein